MERPIPSMQLFHKLFDSLHEIVCALDTQGRFVYINHACFKLWGYKPEELIGVPCFFLMVEEDRDISFQATRDAYLGANIPTYENRYYHKNGSIVTMFWQGGWDLGDQLIYSTGRDISEKKRLEALELQYKHELHKTKQQLEDFLERITDGFVGLDAEARVTYWNKTAETIIQLSQKDVIGSILWDVLPEPSRTNFKRHYDVIKAANKPIQFEFFSERLNRWIDINTYVSGNGLSIFFRDITEHKQLQEQQLKEKELQQKQITAAVLKATEAERTYVGKELHDNVNQVLTTVKLYNELCLSGTCNTEQILKKSAQLLQQSIDEIRALSKHLTPPCLGRISLRESISELVETINNTNRLQVQFEYKNEDLKVTEEVHIAVYRILQEHLTNIIKHAEADTVWINLKVKDDSLTIAVRDNGKGFDMHKKSSGIGITNMTMRAESLNGTLQLNSAPGRGCTLQVCFPPAG